MYFTRSLCFSLLSLLLLVGCESQSLNQEHSPEPNEISAQNVQSRFTAVVPSHASDDDLSNSRAALNQSLDELDSFQRLADEAETWRKAHEAIQNRLDRSSPIPQFRREQMAGHVMLTTWLNEEGDIPPEKQEALAFYTDLMIKNESPQAVEISKALARLEGHWDSERIAEAAETVATAARQHRSSTIDLGQNAPKIETADSGYQRRLQEALSDLREMSQQG